MIGSLIDRIFVVVGAFIFSQAPQFFSLYSQRLGGHVAELTLQIRAMEKVAEKMHSDPELVVVLSGHLSEPEAAQISVGIDGKMNQVKADKLPLGRERAQVIKTALINRNIAADKIYTFDCADNMPIAPNDTEEGASMNQRIYGKALKADDFYMGSGDEHSLTYYKGFCQQF